MSKTLIIQGLDFLAKQLGGLGLCENTQAITMAIAEINSSKPNQSWSYTIDELPIFIRDSPRNAQPTLECLTFYLSISITEKSSNNNDKTISNLIIDSNFSILIQGKKKDEDSHFYASWHLDNDTEGNDYLHPKYHMSFGGSQLKKKLDCNLGNVLLLTSPRLPHPPLDGILAIDFVLKHFVTKDNHQQLTESNPYKTYIKAAQRRLWHPYYTAISKHWCPGCNLSVENEKDNVKYLPNLVFNH